MDYIEAPEQYELRSGDHPSIFLAGGITACEDWRHRVRTLLRDAPVIVFNPRRTTFDLARPDNAAQQVAWEYRHLGLAQVTLFWFPACDPRVTVQPITLFELGTALAEARLTGRKIAVGADPAYPRRLDLELQLSHAVPDLPLHDTLADTVTASLRCMAAHTESC